MNQRTEVGPNVPRNCTSYNGLLFVSLYMHFFDQGTVNSTDDVLNNVLVSSSPFPYTLISCKEVLSTKKQARRSRMSVELSGGAKYEAR